MFVGASGQAPDTAAGGTELNASRCDGSFGGTNAHSRRTHEMSDTTPELAGQEFAIDPVTGRAIAIDAPLPENDAPMMGNPVLMRSSAARRSGSKTPLYAAGAAIAAIVLAGGAFLALNGTHQSNSLMTNSA